MNCRIAAFVLIAVGAVIVFAFIYRGSEPVDESVGEQIDMVWSPHFSGERLAEIHSASEVDTLCHRIWIHGGGLKLDGVLLAHNGERMVRIGSVTTDGFEVIDLPEGPAWLSLVLDGGGIGYLGLLFSSESTSLVTSYLYPTPGLLMDVESSLGLASGSSTGDLYFLPSMSSGMPVSAESPFVVPEGNLVVCRIDQEHVHVPVDRIRMFSLSSTDPTLRRSFTLAERSSRITASNLEATKGQAAEWVGYFRLGSADVSGYSYGGSVFVRVDGSAGVLLAPSSGVVAESDLPKRVSIQAVAGTMAVEGTLTGASCSFDPPADWHWREERLRLRGPWEAPQEDVVVSGHSSHDGIGIKFRVVLEDESVIRVPGIQPNAQVFLDEFDGCQLTSQEPHWIGARRVGIDFDLETNQLNSAPMVLSVRGYPLLAAEFVSRAAFLSVDPIGEISGYTPTSKLDLDRIPQDVLTRAESDSIDIDLGAWAFGNYYVSICSPSMGFQRVKLEHRAGRKAPFEFHSRGEDSYSVDVAALRISSGSIVVAGLVPAPLAVFAERLSVNASWQHRDGSKHAMAVGGEADSQQLILVPSQLDALTVKAPGQPCRYVTVHPEFGLRHGHESLGSVSGSIQGNDGRGMKVVLGTQLMPPSGNRVLYTADALPLAIGSDGRFRISDVVPGTYVVFAVDIVRSANRREFLFSSDAASLCEVVAGKETRLDPIDCSSIVNRKK